MSSPTAPTGAPPAGTLRQRLFARLLARLLAVGNTPYERAMAERKRALFGGLTGMVVEIGPGTGVNLPNYARGVRWIGIEPNPFTHARLRAEAERLGSPSTSVRAPPSPRGSPTAPPTPS